MAVDITLVGSVVQVTDGSNQKQCFVNTTNIKYSFDAAGTTLNINFGGTTGLFSILLTSLRVNGSGTAPASVAAALTALSTSVFPA